MRCRLWNFRCYRFHRLYFRKSIRGTVQRKFLTIITDYCQSYLETLKGDSGGPLVSLAGLEPTLAGVISFVHRDGCASGNPAGYVRVEAQLDFILDVIDPEPEPTVLPDDEYES